VPKNFMPVHPFDNGEMKVRDEMLAPHPRTEAEIRKHIAAYYAMISEVDAQIGRVLDAVERSGEAGNTYVMFAGDNGLAVGQHGLMGKQNMYDHSLRVPLVISGPGVKGGEKADGLCHIMDLCPTICDLSGVPAPAKSEGRSLAPVLRNPRARLRTDVFAAYQNFQRAIRTDRLKLILYNVNGEKHTQLFDVLKDPLEINNLAEQPGQAGRVRELRALLAKRSQEAGDKVDVTTW
jgi:arylsulfatase A-like enzyme